MFTNKLRKAPTPPGTPRKSQPSPLQSSPRKNVVSSAIISAPPSPSKSVAKAIMVAPQKSFSQALLRPQSPAEQYWAARALKAETLLSARMTHQRELRSLSYSEETKRSREIAALSQAHETRHARLENFVIVLLTSLGSLMLVIIYLLTSSKQIKQPTSRWLLPSHFTIPILSPFTSVVEHETSVIGTRSITVSVVVLAILLYFVFRHWTAHARAG